jgi:hypothetical protein
LVFLVVSFLWFSHAWKLHITHGKMAEGNRKGKKKKISGKSFRKTNLYKQQEKISPYLVRERQTLSSMARVPGYRSRGPGSILGNTRFYEK